MRFCDFLAFTLTINLSIETQFPSISQCSNDTVSDVASRLFKIAADDYNTDIRASSPELQLAHTVHTFATETNGNLYRPEFQVTLNSKGTGSDIAMIYVQVCSPSLNDIVINGTEFIINQTSWNVSICKQPSTALITKVDTKPLFTISLRIKLRGTLPSNTVLRTFVADSCNGIYRPKDIRLHEIDTNPTMIRKRFKRETEQASDYLVIANQFYIHQLSLDGTRVQAIVSGLSFAIAVDFDFRQNHLYWTDTAMQSIMRSNLDGTNIATILDQSLTQPEGIAVDWINSKLYWTDVVTRWIGVIDLHSRSYTMLLTSGSDANPREIVVDPTTRMLYWTEWGSRTVSRIKKASMDGSYMTVLHDTNIERAYSLVIDINSQELYWADYRLDIIEVSNVNGTNRRILINSGISQPFSLSMLGSMLYLSDWILGVRSVNISGSQEPTTIFNTFCGFTNFYGIQVISIRRQPQVDNPCNTSNGGCSHFCLLSAVDPRGYSCNCPEGAVLNDDTLTCNLSSATAPPPTMTGSCLGAGHTSCCIGNQCTSDTGGCYCDADCYLFGDCCDDITDICQKQNNYSGQHLLFSNSYYVERLSLDGTRTRTIYSGLTFAFGVDFNIRMNYLFWSKNGELWRSNFDGSQALLLLSSDIDTVDDIAVDWITNKLYWTDDGLKRVGVLDLERGYYSVILDVGANTRPRGIIIDPINRFIYWCDWGTVARIERASLDGTGRIVLHSSGLIWPNGLTLDHIARKLYWIDGNLDRIESSNVDGSNRTVLSITSGRIDRPISITILGNNLYFTDGQFIQSVHRNGGDTSVLRELCGTTFGIEAIAEERQPMRSNPCQLNNGGCGHLCLLSSTDPRGYACACHIGFTLTSDQANCSSDDGTTVAPNITTPSHGTCAAAGIIGCCTSGPCQGSPPTCSCDSLCSIFQQCCNDFTPCPIGSITATIIPGNTTLTLIQTEEQRSFHFWCSVQSTEMPNLLWMFTSTFSQVTRVLSNAAGSLDSAYSVTFPDQRSTNLTINNVQLQDDGVYTCIATIGDISEQASSRLSILVAPSTPVIIGNEHYNESDDVLLVCEVITYPSPTIIWIKRGENIGAVILNSQQTQISFTYLLETFTRPTAVSRLMLAGVSSSDNGTYLCQVNTDVPGYTTVSSQLTVLIQDINECDMNNPCQNGGTCNDLTTGYECDCLDTHTGQNCTQDIMLNISQSEPTLIEMPSSMKAEIATPINLTCLAEGYPPPAYQWYKDGMIVPGETKSFFYIPEALPSDRGSYSCQAINKRGQMSSGLANVNISGVQQHIATLTLNHSTTNQVFEEALNIITAPSNMDSSALIVIYAVEILNTTSRGEAVFLVTTLSDSEDISTPELQLYIRTAFESIPSILRVAGLFRYDGCGINTVDNITWPESNIGQIVHLPCPCEEFLQSGQLASRICGGTYSHGGQWMDIDYSQCNSVTNEVTNILCRIALDNNGRPDIRSEAIVNITSQPTNFTASDVSITTLVIDDLTQEAITNMEIRNNYLTAIDNLQQVHPDIVLASEMQNRSSSRVLQSLDRFLDEVEINTTENATFFFYRTFALQVQNVDPSSIDQQIFNVDLGSVEEAMNITGSIDASSLITAMELFNNATAAIDISEEVLKDCYNTLEESTQRLSYSVFLLDTFFRSQDPLMKIGSLIIAARLKCGMNTTNTLVNVTLRSSNDVNTSQGACARWTPASGERFGAWSSSSCREVVRQGNRRTCECSQLGHFGILFDLNPKPLPEVIGIVFAAITYIGVVLSLISLIIFILSYIAIKKLRTAIHGQILISMSCSLTGLYVIFIIGGQVTLIPALCGISSALLQYFLLTFFAWTAIEAIWLYLKLVKIFGLQTIESRFIMGASLFSWLVPLFIVGISGGAGHTYYTSEFYCRATEWPFWFGLFLPLLIMYIFNWIMFIIIILSLCKHMNSIARQTPATAGNSKEESRFNTKNLIIAIVLSITFGLGWGFGFLATSHDVLPVVLIFQAIFTIIVGIQGVLLFIFHGIRNPEVQGLWKSIFMAASRKTRKVYSLAQSTGTSVTRATKHATIPTSPSTDMGLSHSHAIKSPSLTFSDNSTTTADTNIDFEANPAYGNTEQFKSNAGISLDVNIAYEKINQNFSLEGNVYETLN